MLEEHALKERLLFCQLLDCCIKQGELVCSSLWSAACGIGRWLVCNSETNSTKTGGFFPLQVLGGL
jgi:hypothetical protein